MCGIAGLVDVASPSATETLLVRMAGSMAHRGPDDQGVAVVDEPDHVIGLCARRLAIQDCSPRGHQPMHSRATGRWVALNGEIYNVSELRSELQSRGHVFDGHSDTEVVLRGYDEWGMDCLERLRGMFAFAVWDAPERRLVLARDRLGIKPLYFARGSGGRIAFASEIRTLLHSGVVSGAPSAEAIGSFLALGAVQDPLSLVEGVEALPAGHLAIWSAGRLEVREYWSLRRAFEARAPQRSRQDAVDAVRAELEAAVRQHLVSDVPLGVFLSGGIDSSALVGLVSEVAGDRPDTVSVVFPQQEYSEEPFIRQVVERYDTRHQSIVVDDEAVMREVPAAIEAMDAPSFDGINTYIVSGAARRAGLTVTLSGLGADELFGGYDSFRDLPRLRRLRTALPGGLGRGAASAVDRFGSGNDRHDKLARWLRGPESAPYAYALRREVFSADAVRALAPEVDTSALWRLPEPLADELNDVSLLELSVYMRNVLLRDSDVMSMAHSLEIRVPFLDHRLVELVASLPGEWKRGADAPKPLLTSALSDLLPHDVVHRPKMGFTLPFEHWMRGALREDVERVLTDGDMGGEVARHLDPDAVRDVWRRFLDGKAWWQRPWSLYVLKQWGESRRPAAHETAAHAA